MRRDQKRTFIRLSCFLCLLVIIICMGGQSSSERVLQWTRVRYVAPGQSPEARGICPGLTDSKPALIVSRVSADGDASWIKQLEDKYSPCIYNVDTGTDTTTQHLQVPKNRGHEAMAYLTFIIDNYENLPAAGMVFVHGNRFQWHNDHPEYDNAPLLRDLNISRALGRSGYHNLRCDWSVSMCDLKTEPQGSLATKLQRFLAPYDLRASSDGKLPMAFAEIFGGEGWERQADVLLGPGDAIRAQCCAQFVVSRSSIRQHSQNEYAALRAWLMKSKDAPADDRIAGRILSYIWHILFTQRLEIDNHGLNLNRLNSMACPTAKECYCTLYGRCDQTACRPGSCSGQYHLPKDFKLPKDWAASHPWEKK